MATKQYLYVRAFVRVLRMCTAPRRTWVYRCDLNNSVYIFSGVMVALLILTLILYFFLLLLGKWELERRPYAQFRQHNIELHFQVGWRGPGACACGFEAVQGCGT